MAASRSSLPTRIGVGSLEGMPAGCHSPGPAAAVEPVLAQGRLRAGPAPVNGARPAPGAARPASRPRRAPGHSRRSAEMPGLQQQLDARGDPPGRPALAQARPNERTPGVSMIQPPSGSRSATAEVEVCRPLPTPVTVPIARSASGTSALTSVDLPTPECPTSTDSRPVSRSRSRPERRAGRVPAPAPAGRGRRTRRAARRGSARSALVRHEQRIEPAGVRRHQTPVDEPGPRLRVGQCGDDHQLVGVGHQDPFGRIGVVGRSAQHAPTFCDPDDPGERVGGPVVSPTMSTWSPDDDGAAPEFAGPHRGHQRRVGSPCPTSAGVATPVDRDDHRRRGVGVVGLVLVRGRELRAGLTRTSARRSGRRAGSGSAPLRMPTSPSGEQGRRQRAGKSGMVLAVLPMSSITTAGTRNPTTAPAVAIRWSA